MRDLSRFTTAGYDRGRGKATQAAWFAIMNLVFMRWWCPSRIRVRILRGFGAEIAPNVLIRHRVRVLWPWKLHIGENTWIGEGAWLLNLEPISIGAQVCISQEAFLCTGDHDYRSIDFAYRNAPITIDDGAWVGARALVLPGVKIGEEAVVAAGTVVAADLPAHVLSTNRGSRHISESR